MRPELIFIGGINRSGTTLLNGLICSAEGTNPLIHESSYLKSIVSAYHTGLQKYEEHTRYYFESKKHLLDFTSHIFSEFIKLTSSKYQCPETLVLKHPPLTPNFPYIYELAQNENLRIQFLILVRDPRDVIASLLRVRGKLQKTNDSEWKTLPRDMRTLSEYYNMTYQPALTSSNPGYLNSLAVIKYEDLVLNPPVVIDAIEKKTGISIPASAVTDGWERSNIDLAALESANNAWTSDGWGKGITSSNIGSYRNVLTTDEVMQVNRYCSFPMKKFGYIQ